MRVYFNGVQIELETWLTFGSGCVSFALYKPYYLFNGGVSHLGLPWQWHLLVDTVYPYAKLGDTLRVPEIWQPFLGCKTVYAYQGGYILE